MHEMFFNATELFNLGKETHGMDSRARIEHCQSSERKQRLLFVLEELLKLDPTIVQRTVTAPPDACRVINRDTSKSLSKGQSNGRSEDMRKMIKLMDDSCVWSWGALPGPPEQKEARGLNHEGCAYLLAHPDIDWDDLQARAEFIDGKVRWSSHQWPRLCWREGAYNPAKPSEGLLLTKGGKALLLSLSSVDNITGAPGARGSRSKRQNNKGLAKRYRINRVTTSFIAYVAVCVRYAVTSDTHFNETSDGFNYPDFYDAIKQYLEAPAFASRAASLINWWNHKIFGDVYYGSEEPQAPQTSGTLAALLAEVEGDNDDRVPGPGASEHSDD
ncbi:hypothetical protein BN14_11878 [Rhizoctonia solani AG-1 IB]|uniref:Uncharacterized protein n=1 Tax=Thanatephorus cucumeris (strain AG1-IB / isolate 7/3/14) TaxID=1108050 RepID=M5CEM9_THACB|nr:hypothetical protein BN14_11878 [Rhizoctonia solani AG-1 IB]